MRYLITQSLLSAWNYVHTCYPGCEEDAMASFLSTLRKEPEDLTEDQIQNMQNGIAFESAVYAKALGKENNANPKWQSGIEAVAAFVIGAQFQVKLKRELQIGDITFLVYGVLDALKAGTISDIKFKNKSFGSLDLPGEYFDSPQHPIFFYLAPEAHEFQYLVSDGVDLYIERYTPEETVSAESLIAEFVEFLKASDLMGEYQKYWQALS